MPAFQRIWLVVFALALCAGGMYFWRTAGGPKIVAVLAFAIALLLIVFALAAPRMIPL